jgi:hypothetical protein
MTDLQRKDCKGQDHSRAKGRRAIKTGITTTQLDLVMIPSDLVSTKIEGQQQKPRKKTAELPSKAIMWTTTADRLPKAIKLMTTADHHHETVRLKTIVPHLGSVMSKMTVGLRGITESQTGNRRKGTIDFETAAEIEMTDLGVHMVTGEMR